MLHTIPFNIGYATIAIIGITSFGIINANIISKFPIFSKFNRFYRSNN